MNRNAILVLSIALIAPSIGACDQSPSKAETEAREAQRRADNQIAEAAREAGEKAAEAQLKANEEGREASRTLMEARDEYRLKARHDLDQLTTKLESLRAKAQTSTDKVRTQSELAIRELEGRQRRIEEGFKDLEQTSAVEFEKVKTRLEKEFSEFKKSVDALGRKI